MDISNRVVKLSYGNGCSLDENCFSCKIKDDCKCRDKEVKGHKKEYINIGLVWQDNGNQELVS